MKIYSDKITRADLFRTLAEALPHAMTEATGPNSGWHYPVREFEPRKTHAITSTNSDGVATGLRKTYRRGFELFLFVDEDDGGPGTDHTRRRNGGTFGSGRSYGYALTWDEYGQWFALLFDIDPDAWISGWDGLAKFTSGTHRKFVSYSRKSVPVTAHGPVTSDEYHACPTRGFRLALNDPYMY